MANKGKFLKLVMPGQFGKLTSRTSAIGCTVISDYKVQDNRVLVLERPETLAKPVAKRKVTTSSKSAPSPATAFPGQDTANG